jgi:hypothetical protein
LAKPRKAIRDYRKVTGNINGTAELLLSFVENGARFTHLYGDIDEQFYNSVESALTELVTLLHGGAREMYPRMVERLEKVDQDANNIGWGFSDSVSDIVAQLQADLGEPEDDTLSSPPEK